MKEIPISLIIILGFCLSLALLEEESESTTPPAPAPSPVCSCDRESLDSKIDSLEERLKNALTAVDGLEKRLVVLEQDKASQDEEQQSEEAFYQWILDNYAGTGYYHNRKPPTVDHLAQTHNMDREILSSMNLDGNQRSKIHGAAHTNTMDQLRAAHQGTGTINGQKGSISKIGNKPRYRLRCVGGKCYKERIN